MRTFYQLLLNTLLATVTNFTVWFAITFFVYLETRSVFATSIISGMYLVSTAVSGFWLGGIVDHHKKKWSMLLSSILSLIAFVLGFIIYTASTPDEFKNPLSFRLWTLVPTLLFGVIAGNIRSIALPTAITMLVPEDKRDKANGLAGTTAGTSFLVTSIISGFLVGQSGMYMVLLFAIIITIVVIIHLLSIDMEEKNVSENKEEKTGKLDIKGTISIVSKIPGLFALILFSMFNNFLGGVFMSLMDAYGLSLVKVEIWGLLWGFLSTGFIIGGIIIAKIGLGKNPLKSMLLANTIIWTVSTFFTIKPWILLLAAGSYVYMCVMPFIEASEHTILQKVVPPKRQGRVFGFAQSIELAASPLTAFFIGPVTQFFFIPFMTRGLGAKLIGSWFGTGPSRGIALVFTISGIIGFLVTIFALNSKPYKDLSRYYLKNGQDKKNNGNSQG